MIRLCFILSVQLAASEFNRSTVKEKLVDELGDLISAILDPFIPAEFEFVATAKDTVIIVPDSRTPYRDRDGNLHDLSLDNITVKGFADLAGHINTTRVDLELYSTVVMKRLVIRGKYNLKNSTTSTKVGGPFEIQIANVTAKGISSLVVKPDGLFVMNKITSTSLTYDDSNASIKLNIPWIPTDFIKETMLGTLQPYILRDFNVRLTNVMLLETLMQSTAPPANNVVLQPIDWVIFKGRRYVNQLYEPYRIPFFNFVDLCQNVTIGPIELQGLSNFRRADRMSATILDDNIKIGVRFVTGLIRGQSPIIIRRENLSESSDRAHFTIEHLEFTAKLDIKHSEAHPSLSEFHVHGPNIHDGFKIRLNSGGDVYEFQAILYVGIKNWLKRQIEENARSEILDKLDARKLLRVNND